MTNLSKFKKAFCDIEDERDIFYSCITNENAKIKNIFDYRPWDKNTLKELKEKILKDNDFINHIYRVLDANYGVDFSEKFKIEVCLLKDENDYLDNIFVTLEVRLCYEDNVFAEKFNYYWVY